MWPGSWIGAKVSWETTSDAALGVLPHVFGELPRLLPVEDAHLRLVRLELDECVDDVAEDVQQVPRQLDAALEEARPRPLLLEEEVVFL